MRNKTFKVSQEKGEANFGVIWMSLDERLSSYWYALYEDALKQYKHLKKLGREPSFNVRIVIK